MYNQLSPSLGHENTPSMEFLVPPGFPALGLPRQATNILVELPVLLQASSFNARAGTTGAQLEISNDFKKENRVGVKLNSKSLREDKTRRCCRRGGTTLAHMPRTYGTPLASKSRVTCELYRPPCLASCACEQPTAPASHNSGGCQ
jgi:hypothetical protein